METKEKQRKRPAVLDSLKSLIKGAREMNFTKKFYNFNKNARKAKTYASGLEALLYESWKKVNAEFGFVPFRPELSDGMMSYIDMSTKRVYIGSELLKKTSKGGTPDERVVYAACMHETGHYMYHPYDLTTILTELNALKFYDDGRLGGPKASIMRLIYDDIVNETSIIINHKDHNLDRMYRAMGSLDSSSSAKKSKEDAVSLMQAYYSEISGLDFGVKRKDLSVDMQDRLDKLKKIDFLNRARNTYNIREFARIIADISLNTDCRGKQINSFSEQEVQKAMQDLAQQCSPEEYQKIRKFMEDAGCKDKLTDGENADLVEYYKGLASKYAIRILGKPMSSAESDCPSELKEWEISSPVSRINPYRSFGKIIPGITKQWVKGTYDTYNSIISIPNSIIVIDSSGSMQNPRSMKSNAVVGAFSIARAYILNGAKVDVINFSDNAGVTPYKSELDAYRSLIVYNAGGTKPPIKALEELLSNQSKDITIITDGFGGASFQDIDAFMRKLDSIAEHRRVSFVYIADGPSATFVGHDKIKFHHVSKIEDIAGIVLGDLNWAPSK